MTQLISPESFEIANAYIQYGSIQATANATGVPAQVVSEYLEKKEVKRYIDNVFLDAGYRNRNTLAAVLDEMIASKLEEAKESGMYTKKDLLELLQFAHKIRMDDIANQNAKAPAQTNVQINNNYGSLMSKLMGTTVVEQSS